MGSQPKGSISYWNQIETDLPVLNCYYIMYVPSSFAYCYHSVDGIRSGLAQSDPFKRRLL
jgi:hypothetical protein